MIPLRGAGRDLQLTGADHEPLALPALLWLDGWQGHYSQPVTVIGRTAAHYRITPRPGAAGRVRLAGKARSIGAGESALVPRYAVAFEGLAEY